MSVIDAVKSLGVPPFCDLAPADLDAVVAILRPRRFAARQQLFARGDPGTELFVVLSGRIRISILSPDGRELSFRMAERGEMIGEIAVLDGGARSAAATAVEPADTLTLGRADLLRLMGSRPGIGQAFIQMLCRRLRDTSEQLESIALLRIESRLARFFLALARSAKPRADGTVNVSLTISQGELALLLGATRPKVNVALGYLETEGAIERRGHRVVCNMDKLTTIAGAEAE